MTCCFFGNRDIPDKAYKKLQPTIINLIKNQDVTHFLLGSGGAFDTVVLKTLKRLKVEYPYIKYTVVLAYMPKNTINDLTSDYTESFYPYCLKNIPARVAIPERNKWMINHSDMVVACIPESTGATLKFIEYSKRKGKTVINLI